MATKGKGKKFAFPDANAVAPNSAPVICDRERVLNLYNQATGSDAQKVTPKVEKWFTNEAHNKQWAYAGFTKETGGNNGGCILVSRYQLLHQAENGNMPALPGAAPNNGPEEDDDE